MTQPSECLSSFLSLEWMAVPMGLKGSQRRDDLWKGLECQFIRQRGKDSISEKRLFSEVFRLSTLLLGSRPSKCLDIHKYCYTLSISLHPGNESDISGEMLGNEFGPLTLTKGSVLDQLALRSVSDGAKDAQLTKSEEEDLEVGPGLEEDLSGSLEPVPKSYSK